MKNRIIFLIVCTTMQSSLCMENISPAKAPRRRLSCPVTVTAVQRPYNPQQNLELKKREKNPTLARIQQQEKKQNPNALALDSIPKRRVSQ